ncbi:MAG: carboxypeptidase regulatory-like domain-containing protein [Chloroflexi bacterium]|nr:carboxypeptidase regulatory-like domain-containing protein [Chloroflexota bacterium]
MALFDRVVNDEPALRGLGIAVITTSLDTESNTIDVELSTERLDAVAMIAARHGPNVVARVGDPTGALLKARGTIVVRVTDTSGRRVEAGVTPIPLFAEIPLDSVPNQRDRDGNVRFDDWYAGRWRLTAEAPGYAPTSVELDLSPGAEVSVEIVLLPAP